MSEIEFFQTALGRTFYERTMPGLVQELGRLNDLLARLVERLPPPPSPVAPQPDSPEVPR